MSRPRLSVFTNLYNYLSSAVSIQLLLIFFPSNFIHQSRGHQLFILRGSDEGRGTVHVGDRSYDSFRGHPARRIFRKEFK